MGMAGAFTSLGGDIASSIGINPRGSGHVPPQRHLDNPHAGLPALAQQRLGLGRQRLHARRHGNVGAVLNLYEGASSHVVKPASASPTTASPTSTTATASRRRAAHRTRYRSIADAFSRMMGQSGLFPIEGRALNYGYGDSYF